MSSRTGAAASSVLGQNMGSMLDLNLTRSAPIWPYVPTLSRLALALGCSASERGPADPHLAGGRAGDRCADGPDDHGHLPGGVAPPG
jgi:hypothetical protein